MRAAFFETGRFGIKRFLPDWLFESGPKPNQAANECEPQPNGRKHILIVDDDAVVRLVTTRVLQNKGYVVTAAADCSEAIGALSNTKPDVILLDLNFPPDIWAGGGVAWDGLRLMFWLRGLKNARGARFIIITSSDSEECKARALAAGVAGFFQKPIDHEQLLEVIQREFESSANESSPAPRFQVEI